MALEHYRADSTELLNRLAEGELLARYVQALEAEAGSLAEAPQLAFGRRMLGLVARLGAEGVEQVASTDRAGLDALLTDVFALATWHRWPLPVEPLPPGEVDLEHAQRGLLGAETEGQGAVLYVIDEQTVALRRSRDDQDIALREREH